jgi:hypothetical protein
MTVVQLEYSADELLASHPFETPLVAGGVRCHGGFDAGGAYVSPRTRHRLPAIAAWQAQHRADFGTELLDVALATWPGHYPNVEQARWLLDRGVREPIVAILTRIGTVEGFGAVIRNSVVPDFGRLFVEDVRGTALAHLDRGLYEAHARDEAGFDGEGGHQQMWFAARDIAFEHPVTEDETVRMLERLGLSRPGSGGAVDAARLRAEAIARRALSDDIDFEVEALLDRMIRLLLIEINAFHTFAWAEEVLSDTGRVAGDGEAARLVSYVRTDETPHVEYLRTVLSEMRDRTFVGSSGRRYPGTDIVGRLWERALADSLGPRRDEGVRSTRQEVAHAVEGRADAADVLARFDDLADPVERELREPA